MPPSFFFCFTWNIMIPTMIMDKPSSTMDRPGMYSTFIFRSSHSSKARTSSTMDIFFFVFMDIGVSLLPWDAARPLV